MPCAMLAEPVDGINPPLRRLGFDIGGIGDLPFNFGDYAETGIRLQNEIRHVAGRNALVAIGDEKSQAVILHPSFHAG